MEAGGHTARWLWTLPNQALFKIRIRGGNFAAEGLWHGEMTCMV